MSDPSIDPADKSKGNVKAPGKRGRPRKVLPIKPVVEKATLSRDERLKELTQLALRSNNDTTRIKALELYGKMVEQEELTGNNLIHELVVTLVDPREVNG